MARILAAVPERAVELSEDWAQARTVLRELLNREIMPMLRLLRRAVNGPLAASDVKTANYQIVLSDELVLWDSTNGVLELTLPMSAPKGTVVWVADAAGQTAINNVTVVPADGDSIEGGVSVSLESNWIIGLFLKVNATTWSIGFSAG